MEPAEMNRQKLLRGELEKLANEEKEDLNSNKSTLEQNLKNRLNELKPQLLENG